tara:strand:- start:315 stop:533 length:219 start_codon:yes stop_codon:yes gene_type:complete
MSQKFILDGKEYDVEDLGDKGKSSLMSFRFATGRIEELSNTLALLQRAKKSYIDSLKQEMISSKSGINFDDD